MLLTYMRPGTKVVKRIARGDQGMNPLDAACKKHDLSYLHNRDDLSARDQADYELKQSAWKRVKLKDSSVGENGASWLVTNIMKTKQRFGMGVASRVSKRKTRGKKKHRRCGRLTV